MAANLKLLSNLNFGVIPGAQQRARFFQIRLGERLGPAADMSAPARGLETGVDALAQDVALELGVLRFSAKCGLCGVHNYAKQQPQISTLACTSWCGALHNAGPSTEGTRRYYRGWRKRAERSTCRNHACWACGKHLRLASPSQSNE